MNFKVGQLLWAVESVWPEGKRYLAYWEISGGRFIFGDQNLVCYAMWKTGGTVGFVPTPRAFPTKEEADKFTEDNAASGFERDG